MLPLTRVIYSRLTNITCNSYVALHTAYMIQCREREEKHSKPPAESGFNSPPVVKEHSKAISVETSMRYLKSTAYKATYGEDFVWSQYRRNHKGMYAPRKTRKTCIRQGKTATGNPCPICRDEYLVLDHRNTNLLEQFISPYNGQVISSSKTGLCQKSHLRLIVALEQARDCGLITYDVPFRGYDYCEYYGNQDEQHQK